MNLDKKILGASAAYILGLRPLVEVKGTKEEIKAFEKVLVSSKALYESLEGEDTLDRVDIKLKNKKTAAQEFKAITGTLWPF